MSNRNLLKQHYAFLGFRRRYRITELSAARPVGRRSRHVRGARGRLVELHAAASWGCRCPAHGVARGRLVELHVAAPRGAAAAELALAVALQSCAASPSSFLEQLLQARTTKLSCLKFINYLTGYIPR